MQVNSETRSKSTTHPALQAFLEELGPEKRVGQVQIQPQGALWELRHIQDRSQPASALRTVPSSELRALAQFSQAGAFRPLRSAPNLRQGWRAAVNSPDELALALDHLYPGFLADWHAVRQDPTTATDFRSYADRQTGMYRIVALLTDAQVARVVQAGCSPRFCLKCRCWSGAGLTPDLPSQKSLIPCLEPCAVLMEFARKSMRLEQVQPLQVTLGPEEWESIAAAVQAGLDQSDPGLREADFSAPMNPRRLQWTLDKLNAQRELGPTNTEI